MASTKPRGLIAASYEEWAREYQTPALLAGEQARTGPAPSFCAGSAQPAQQRPQAG
jgi:hypothetical protein